MTIFHTISAEIPFLCRVTACHTNTLRGCSLLFSLAGGDDCATISRWDEVGFRTPALHLRTDEKFHRSLHETRENYFRRRGANFRKSRLYTTVKGDNNSIIYTLVDTQITDPQTTKGKLCTVRVTHSRSETRYFLFMWWTFAIRFGFTNTS